MHEEPQKNLDRQEVGNKSGNLWNPVGILREATKYFPALRYAWAVLGILAVVAIVGRIWRLSVLASVGGFGAVLIGMVVVAVFAKGVTGKTRDSLLAGPAKMLIYFSIGAFIVVMVLALACLVFGKPIDLRYLIVPTEPDPLVWENQPINVVGGSTSYPVGFSLAKVDWRDIAWIGSEGWLAGSREDVGGARPDGRDTDVGRGALLHSTDGGYIWTEFDRSRIPSEAGRYNWGPFGNSWHEVAGINRIYFYPRSSDVGDFKGEVYLASETGIYRSYDDGDHWERMTPRTANPTLYAKFFGLADVSAYTELYASGWQGIAHWSASNGHWDLQYPTYSWPIMSVAVGPHHEVFAVGNAPPGKTGFVTGAVYYLPPGSEQWTVLKGVQLERDEGLLDICILHNASVVVAVGGRGVIIRGTLGERDNWQWTRIQSNTDQALRSIASENEQRLWIVGDSGTILYSDDVGLTWANCPVKVAAAPLKVSLNRVRFFSLGNQTVGWIVGAGVVLRKRPTPSE